MIDKIKYGEAASVVEYIMTVARKENLEIAIAISDPYGELLAFARTDSCGLPSIQVAISKSFSAARLGQSTREFLNDGYPLDNLSDNRYTSYPGGFPIKSGDLCLGGIGISGLAPEDDEKLALRGIAYYHDD